MQIRDHQELDLQKVIAEIRKLNAETALLSKKLKWYELTLALFLVGATVFLTKLFL